jgi:UDP-N-acetylglucosamine--N-acetylmuramyl-(pentapeptide) pyrophosphoryl-undecaprenol N-acetylglucosamine transferase
MIASKNSRQPLSLVFAGGGTAGHLFAGLAVAEEIRWREPSTRVAFVGTGQPWESRQVRRAGYAYHALRCRPWPGASWRLGHFLLDSGSGFLAARHLLRQQQVSAVVGLGGYASAPAARAALHLGLPLMLIEPNAVPGRVTRWLARRSAAVCAAFESARNDLPGANVVSTGAPVRGAFSKVAATARRAPRLYITGGSLGSAALNESVPEALARVRPLMSQWEIVHQTGAAGERATRRRYAELGVAATVAAFFDPPIQLGENDLAICRAGGLTLAELSLTGTPAIVVPYPHASDDHQRRNALALATAGACRYLEQTTPSTVFAGRLSAGIQVILADADARRAMSAAMRGLARPHAAAEIAELVCRMADETSKQNFSITGLDPPASSRYLTATLLGSPQVTSETTQFVRE